MENRTPESRINEQRARLAGAALVDTYYETDKPIMLIDPDNVGQLQNLITDMMLTLKPEDAIRAGLRMQLKSTGAINDLTILGDIVGGQHVFELTDFADAKDYEFMKQVLKGIVKEIKDRAKYALAADNHVRSRDEIVKD